MTDIQLAEAEVQTAEVVPARLDAPRYVQQVAERRRFSLDNDLLSEDGRPVAARGVIVAVFLSVPLWVLIGFTVYILV